MYTTDALRQRYARTSDNDLLALMSVGPERLTPESQHALAEEAMRRGLKLPMGWTPVAAPVSGYGPPVARHYGRASIGARFLACIVDGIVSVVPVTAVTLFVVFSGMIHQSTGLSVLGIIASALWTIWYGFTKDGRDAGQSIGKDMMDLMVVSTETNAPCTVGQSAIRALILWLVGLIPVVGWIIEPIMVLADQDGRRLGDRAAGTQVISVDEYVPNVQ